MNQQYNSPAKKFKLDDEISSNCSLDTSAGIRHNEFHKKSHKTMRRMADSDVLISGLGGLGVEVAKNVILAGVKSVTLHDTKVCSLKDLSSQFYLTESSIGQKRAVVSCEHLSELNQYVPTTAYTGQLDDEFCKKFRVIVLTENDEFEHRQIAAIARKLNIALIIAKTCGLFGEIFCDFGPEFAVYDVNGQNPLLAMIASITKEKESIVTCLDETRHGFEDGDYVTCTEIDGMTELNQCEPLKIKVLGPFTFSIGDTTKYSHYIQGGIAIQVKMPTTVSFKPLKEAEKDPSFVLSDYSKLDHPQNINIAFTALSRYNAKFKHNPRPWNKADAEDFLAICKDRATELGVVEIKEELLKLFGKISDGDLCPVNAVIGGITAQEVMKACSGKFMPIMQFFSFDAIECLPEDLSVLTEEECAPVESRCDSQIAVYGRIFQEKVNNLRYFIVGAGAIGCELLKNFAMMGVGAGKDGEIIVTDMDLIEKSNLNRQFLFRPHDVQSAKSRVAAAAVKQMNPDLNIKYHTIRVEEDTENVFNDDFFASLNGVVNALDDVKTSGYMDRRCNT